MNNAGKLIIGKFFKKQIWKIVQGKLYDKYITTPEFHKLTAENFTARLKQANLLTKLDFDKKLTSFNRKITSNKTKCLESIKLKPLYTAFFIA